MKGMVYGRSGDRYADWRGAYRVGLGQGQGQGRVKGRDKDEDGDELWVKPTITERGLGLVLVPVLGLGERNRHSGQRSLVVQNTPPPLPPLLLPPPSPL